MVRNSTCDSFLRPRAPRAWVPMFAVRTDTAAAVRVCAPSETERQSNTFIRSQRRPTRIRTMAGVAFEVPTSRPASRTRSLSFLQRPRRFTILRRQDLSRSSPRASAGEAPVDAAGPHEPDELLATLMPGTMAEPPAYSTATASSSAQYCPPRSTFAPSLDETVHLLSHPDEDMQCVAVARLAVLIDEASGVQALELGARVRGGGTLEVLLALLDRPSTQQDALRVIGNLASNAVDQNAADTKRMLSDLGAFPRILRLIYAQSLATVVYALGTVQNMCARRDHALHMREVRADARLRELASSSSNGNSSSSQAMIHFATGCLSNMETVLGPSFIPDPRVEPAAASTSSAAPPAPTERPHLQPLHPSRTPSPQSSTQQHPGFCVGDRPTSSDGAPLCAVCLDRPVNTALTPCFHAGFCNGCAVTISFNRYPCPICRSPVTGMQRIYL